VKATVIHHSADYDGIFCREIARKFLPEAQLIGWHFGDPAIPVPSDKGPIYVMDLPVDQVFGFSYPLSMNVSDFGNQTAIQIMERLIWIDHHKSSIDTHPKDIPGYRIDGVAACRMAWQWFAHLQGFSKAGTVGVLPMMDELPDIFDFKNRRVVEPLAVRLAGEYDVWDHRDNDVDVAFQFGLDSQYGIDWEKLFRDDFDVPLYVEKIVVAGRMAMQCYAKRDADVMRTRSFLTGFEGFRFLCLNTAKCSSNTFSALDVEATGHDALLAFYWTGKDWSVSMYHAAHRKELDLSEIAKRYGGGGHRGACGFLAKTLPFVQ